MRNLYWRHKEWRNFLW